MFSTKENRKSRVYDIIGWGRKSTMDSGHGPFHWLKWLFSLDLNILRNIWDNVSTQVSKIYNTVLVFFGYLNKKILHIVPLTMGVLVN